ncbi:site-specific integrase, partial [Micromonospora aurantiaca]|nr:site-specific integrase [Micromonospora aurantiaca]
MGFARPRTAKDGRVRYIALYRDQRNKVRSAGTYSSERQADKAWQKAEAKLALDRLPDATKGRQRFRRYVEDVWFP